MHLSVCLVFSGTAAAGAPLRANIGESLLLAPFLCPQGGVTYDWCITGGGETRRWCFYHRRLAFYLNLGFTLCWAPDPGHFVVVFPGAAANKEEVCAGSYLCRLMQSPYILL